MFPEPLSIKTITRILTGVCKITDSPVFAAGERGRAEMGKKQLSDDYILECMDISKRFGGVQALDGVSFNLKEGEFHALVGENGAGKSTLIKIISGLYQKDTGTVLYHGEKFEIVSLMVGREINLSGGNQQKVSIAKWLASGSELLVFDEPTYGIDVGAKHDIYQLLRKLSDDGKGVLGGISLAGGKGNILGVLVGIAIIGVLQSGVIMVDMPSYYRWMATGFVLIVAVYFDERLNRKS